MLLVALVQLAAGLQVPLFGSLPPRERAIVVKPRREVHHPIGALYGASLARSVADDPALPTFALRAHRRRLLRPRARAGTAAYDAARRGVMRQRRGQQHPMSYTPMGWDEVEVEAPDVGDLDTLLALAAMSGNAYWSADETEDDGKWYDVGGRFNLSSSFGWAESGLRGHVFAAPDNSTVRHDRRAALLTVVDRSGHQGHIGWPFDWRRGIDRAER